MVRSQITHQAPRLVEAKWYPPDIDVMASCWAHHVPQYISQFWDGASIAQDALVQDWGAWPLGTPTAGRHGRRSKPCLFVFPPSGLLAQVLLKIKFDQPTIWLVCTRFLRPVDDRFVDSLPVQHRGELTARDVSHIVKPTRINPAYHSGEKWRTPLQILFISWEPVRAQQPTVCADSA